MNRINCVTVLLPFCLSCTSIEKKEKVTNLEIVSSISLENWQPDYLDIHQINTGNVDTGIFILPGGTIMSIKGEFGPYQSKQICKTYKYKWKNKNFK